MVELQFESTLTMEEIEQNFAGVDFFAGIMDGLEEALAYEKRSGCSRDIREKAFSS